MHLISTSLLFIRRCLLKPSIVSIILLLIFSENSLDAAERQAIWKRGVVRTISIGVQKAQAKDSTNDQFSKILIKRVENGYITAWPSLLLDTPLTNEQIHEMLTLPPIFSISDSSNSSFQKLHVEYREFDCDIRKFRILEEWSFETSTGRTTVRIIALAPLKDIFDDNGSYRGSINLFWVKWAEISGLIASFVGKDGNSDIAKAIWKDYFEDDNMKSDYLEDDNSIENYTLQRTAIQKIQLSRDYPILSDDEHFCFRHLNDDFYDLHTRDSNVAGKLHSAVIQGTVKAYMHPVAKAVDGSFDSTVLRVPVELDEVTPPVLRVDAKRILQQSLNRSSLIDITKEYVDTVISFDASDREERKLETRKNVSVSDISIFYVLQTWTFSIRLGSTVIENVAIAPINRHNRDDGRLIELPIYWMRYMDVKDMLNYGTEYDVRNSIEWNLWTDRFRRKRI